LRRSPDAPIVARKTTQYRSKCAGNYPRAVPPHRRAVPPHRKERPLCRSAVQGTTSVSFRRPRVVPSTPRRPDDRRAVPPHRKERPLCRSAAPCQQTKTRRIKRAIPFGNFDDVIFPLARFAVLSAAGTVLNFRGTIKNAFFARGRSAQAYKNYRLLCSFSFSSWISK